MVKIDIFQFFVSSILVQNLDFWHENSNIWYFLGWNIQKISSNFGAKFQKCFLLLGKFWQIFWTKNWCLFFQRLERNLFNFTSVVYHGWITTNSVKLFHFALVVNMKKMISHWSSKFGKICWRIQQFLVLPNPNVRKAFTMCPLSPFKKDMGHQRASWKSSWPVLEWCLLKIRMITTSKVWSEKLEALWDYSWDSPSFHFSNLSTISQPL